MGDLILYRHDKPLPEPFQTWAQLRKDQCPVFKGTASDALHASFDWGKTPEGHEFWSDLNNEKSTEPHPSWGSQEPQEPLVMEDIFVGLK